MPTDVTIDGEWISFEATGGWYIESEGKDYRLTNLEIAETNINQIVISLQKFVTPQSSIDSTIGVVSGWSQDDDITINGVNYLRMNTTTEDTFYLLTSLGDEADKLTVQIYMVGATLDQAMPVLETITLK